ncbi:alpha-mannosidase [Edaphobacter acidisoli]|uniref:Alpha-mannosidase n=1 Tax=Edaphobacter acidisoli TaxID=2040573 RepID=A0A916RXJ7_9BACT|nr:glycoside hydrolase family 38 C-terminal domain-containing protein [Edaphobacter acidisoli]GGA74141.1 alpha-mannosidase [Edaphobacter acidisoli]
MTNHPHLARARQLASVLTLAATSLLIALAPAANAQRRGQAANITSSLSPAAQQVIERLSTFDELSAPDWRYHAGDLPHGEDPALDDSSWQVVKARSEAPNESVWYRRTIEVPKTLNGYDLTGARIWFAFHASANGPMPQIIYFNGRRVALGDDLEPIILFDKAQPGEKVLVAVKLLNTVDKKSFRGVTLKIDFASNRPSPEDLRTEFLSSTLLIPTLSKNPTADMATLEHAITTVDLSALDSGDQAKFDASLKQAATELEPLKPMFRELTYNVTGNSHIDAAWLWPWTETVDVVKRTFGTALQLMNEYPQYTYTQSAAQYNEWLADKYPPMNDEIKQRIKEGRWEVVGGMWVEPDLNMPGGESTARSILLGKRWYLQHYGVDVRIGWNPDSFGYNWQLPQIYKRSGIDYFVTQKMTWNDTNPLPFKLFWWQSPDGSKVLTYFPQGYGNNNLNPVRLAEDIVVARKRAPGLTDMMDLYGIGDHGGGATRTVLDEGDHWSQPDTIIPNMHFGTAQPYFSKVEQDIAPDSKTWDYKSIADGYQFPTPVEGKVSIPTWDDEMYLEYHRGVFTTQARQKYNMRYSEERTLNAEKLASLAWLDGDRYPTDEFTESWKKITFNQFHDLAAGSGIGVIYKDAQKDFDQVYWADNEISTKALNTLAARVDTHVATGVPVLVFNPLAWHRDGNLTVSVQMPSASPNGVSVLDAHDRVLPSAILSSNPKTNTFKLLIEAKDVPSMGYEVLHVVPGKRPFTSDLKASGTTLENAALKVVVDPNTGCITSLYDKKSNFETIAQGGCGNQLQTFHDLPKDYDAWNIDPGTLDHMTPITEVDSVKLVENTPVRATIRVTRTWQSSKFVQDIQLYAGADTVNVVNNVDWHETHVLLKASFPLSATSGFATYEIPYGSIQRPTTRNNSWEKARFEVPAQRWADLGNTQHGFSLINESKYGYDGVDNQLRLTLLRSPIWPDPNADRGHQHFSYELYPHTGTWQQALTERKGYSYNYRLRAVQVESHTGAGPAEHSFLSVEPENVVLTAVKKAEDSNGLIFHVFEWAGKSANVTFTLPPGATAATETNLMEKPEGSALTITDNKVTVPIKPYEILALRADYPHETEHAETK